MQAHAHLRVGRDDRGRSAVRELRSEAPLLLRQTPASSDGVVVQLIGGAAGPLGGDDLHLRIEVEPASSLRVRSVAASLAQPSAAGGASGATTTVAVGDGGSLDWWPEPLVSVRGSHHVVRTAVDLHGTATLRWVDAVCLGRHAEPSGVVDVRQRICVDGSPLVAHELRFGSSRSSGLHGDARVAITALVRGPVSLPSETALRPGVRAARMPVDERTTAWIALGDHLERLTAVLVELGLARDDGIDPAHASPACRWNTRLSQ